MTSFFTLGVLGILTGLILTIMLLVDLFAFVKLGWKGNWPSIARLSIMSFATLGIILLLLLELGRGLAI